MAANKNMPSGASDMGKTGQQQRPQSDQGAHYASQGASTSRNDIREHMNVVGSCGTKIGVVDRVEGKAIKLTKNDSRDGQHHFVPMDWVDRVDNQVHLKKNSQDAQHDWKSDARSCECAG